MAPMVMHNVFIKKVWNCMSRKQQVTVIGRPNLRCISLKLDMARIQYELGYFSKAKRNFHDCHTAILRKWNDKGYRSANYEELSCLMIEAELYLAASNISLGFVNGQD